VHGVRRGALLASLLLLGARAESQVAPVAPAAPAAATVCSPREAAAGSPALSPAFTPTWLVGAWRLTVWVNGRGVPDTVISGTLILFPRQLDSVNKAFERVTPLIGHTDLELEYVPGIEPFRTPAISRSSRFPGVELRIDADGPRLVLGNPTQIASEPVVSLGVASSANFFLFAAFSHDFRGQWSLSGTSPDRAWGGFCAVRLTDG
jgi:hypothetical protein